MKKTKVTTALLLGSATASMAIGSMLVSSFVFRDDFDDNAINPAVWSAFTVGSGPTVSEVNQRLEVSFPAGSASSPTLNIFGAGYASVCSLNGDFDIQADYHLLNWPPANGVRVAISVGLGRPLIDPGSTVERTSSIGVISGEVYLTNFADGTHGVTQTTDRMGTLRLARSGGTLTGFYFGSTDWVPIHTGPVTTADVRFNLLSWTHDDLFPDQEVMIAFDNFIVNQGQLVGLRRGVSIDIKPGGDVNTINPLGLGTIPVAVLSEPAFDAPGRIDGSTLTFGSTGDEPSLSFCTSDPEDVNGDGLLDLVCHFHNRESGFGTGDTRGTLRGRLTDDTPIEGRDSVRIVTRAPRPE